MIKIVKIENEYVDNYGNVCDKKLKEKKYHLFIKYI